MTLSVLESGHLGVHPDAQTPQNTQQKRADRPWNKDLSALYE
jgi:hypothetical protein